MLLRVVPRPHGMAGTRAKRRLGEACGPRRIRLAATLNECLNRCFLYVLRVRDAERTGSTSRFLGVRLTLEENGRLEEFRRVRGLATTSDAVRALVNEGAKTGVGAAELPATLSEELAELVELGYARNAEEALAVALQFGLADIARLHGDSWRQMRSHARDVADRRRVRERADREGRGLLRR